MGRWVFLFLFTWFLASAVFTGLVLLLFPGDADPRPNASRARRHADRHVPRSSAAEELDARESDVA